MTKSAGAYARTLEGFVLGCELRARRLAAGATPKELAGLLGIPRAKIDALELGYYDSRDPRKRPGHLSRDELVHLLEAKILAIPAAEANALLCLAHESGAVGGGEPYRPLARHTLADARRVASELTERHAHAFRAQERAPAMADADWAPPSQRCPLFVDREAEVDELVAALLDPAGPALVLVSGFPGSGKSELLQVALRRPELRAAFHGLRWLSARQREFLAGGSGGTSSVRADDVIRDLAAGLRSTVADLPSALQATRWLIAIDNSEAVADEEVLIGRLARKAGASRIVFTSRNTYRAPFLRNVPRPGALGGLAEADARRLLARDRRHAVSADEAAHVYAVTKGAPLALQWFAGQLARDDATPVAAELDCGSDDLYAFMFAGSWARLTPRSREVLDYLAHQIVDPAPRAVLAASAVAGADLDGALHELREMNLVESSRADDDLVLGLHPLTAAFVRDRIADRSTWSGRREAAWAPGLGYLREALVHDARGSHAAAPLGGTRNYLNWMRDALESGASDVVFVSWLKLSRYLWEHWHWSDFERCEEIAALASERLASSHQLAATMLGALSQCDRAYQTIERAQYDEGLRLLASALEHFDVLDDDAGRSLAHRYRGLLYLRRGSDGDLARSRTEFETTLAVIARGRARGFPVPGSEAERAAAELAELGVWDTLIAGYAAYRRAWHAGEAEVMNLMSGVLLKEGRARDAVEAARRAIAVALENADRWPGSEAAPMLNLARALLALGERDEARRVLAEALAVTRDAERRDLEEGALIQLAELDLSASRYDDARGHASAALAIAHGLGQTAEIAAIQTILHHAAAAD